MNAQLGVNDPLTAKAEPNSHGGAKSLSMTERHVSAAVDYILEQRLLQPQVAIILGSGLGGLADDLTHCTAVPYAEIPHFQKTHAVGHAGQLNLGYLGGMPVVMMQGRCHRYEGHSHASVCFPVRVMQALGATVLIVTNAAGGLNSRYRSGDLMLVDQHIDCLWPRNAACAPPDSHSLAESLTPAELPLRAPGQVRTARQVYDEDLLDRARRVALRHEIAMHRGTYVATLGPTYETRSEYRMFRWMGGDAVGMSTVPEVLTARELDMRVLALSVITNVACTDSLKGTSHEEVVECGKQVEPKLRHLVQQLLEEMAGPAD
jgi:purine-nucleoside phosphorylase